MDEIIDAMAKALFEETLREAASLGIAIEPWDSPIPARHDHYRRMARAAWNALIKLQHADEDRRACIPSRQVSGGSSICSNPR